MNKEFIDIAFDELKKTKKKNYKKQKNILLHIVMSQRKEFLERIYKYGNRICTIKEVKQKLIEYGKLENYIKEKYNDKKKELRFIKK